MPNRPGERPGRPGSGRRAAGVALALLGQLRSVRARTTLIATAAVAVVLVGAVAALAGAVERTLTSRLEERGAEQVDAVADRLIAGVPPADALAAAARQPTAPGTGRYDVPTYVAILDHEGAPVVGSGFFAMPGFAGGVTVTDSQGSAPVVKVGSSDLAIAQRPVEVGGRLLLVVAASPLAQVASSVNAIVRASLVGVPLVTLLVGAVTWTATGRALRPIERIRAEVDELSTRTLNRRVPVPRSGDEVARLAETMNGMLDRLQAASSRQLEFVSDASHELRSPVATIRTELEVAMAHPAASDWARVAAGVLAETGRLEGIVDDLLLLARLDEHAAVPVETVDVGLLTGEVAARMTGVHVDVQVPDGLLVSGASSQLTSVLRNLLDNAARHGRSTVAVTGRAEHGTVLITVDDDGPGIPATDRQRVFQRFTRLEPSRGRAGGGVGLGLAVVDRVVRHHHGSVTVTDSPAGGARFQVRLPAADRSAAPCPA